MKTLKPLLIVVSAPSGGGKSTMCRRLLAEREDIDYSISCTTRKPRGAEVNGREYHFLTEAEFEKRVKNGEFLEHAMVFGNHYGTPRAPVEAMAASTAPAKPNASAVSSSEVPPAKVAAAPMPRTNAPRPMQHHTRRCHCSV